LQIAGLRADGLDDAHRLVTEDVTLCQEGAENLVEVQVGPAQAGGGDADDRVGGLLDAGVGDGVHAHVAPAVPGQGLHWFSDWSGGSGPRTRDRRLLTHRVA
jgi:hypothetical protein